MKNKNQHEINKLTDKADIIRTLASERIEEFTTIIN